MIKKLFVVLVPALAVVLSACSAETAISVDTTVRSGNTDITETGTAADASLNDASIEYVPVSVQYEKDDLDADWKTAGASSLLLDGSKITVDGGGVVVNGSLATITSAGTYIISGKLGDGQILVNSREKGTIRLVLNNADIACSTSTPLYIVNASKVIITLADGTLNYISDGKVYQYENPDEDEPNAAVFSKSDLTINGHGSLTVNALYDNGIQSKDGLKITGGDINVNAVNDGIKGKDYVAVKAGNIIIDAGGDGMQSSGGTDTAKGYVSIEGGVIDITAGRDCIQAETNVSVTGGEINITSGGGSVNSSRSAGWGSWGAANRGTGVSISDSSDSAKGIKAKIDVTIQDCTIYIDSSDDSLHSNGSLTVNSGHLIIASGDDGIHSDSTLDINGGYIGISKSYEGIESMVITVNDGEVRIVSSDDGINAAGGVDGSSVNGRPGQNTFDMAANSYLHINGGSIIVDSGGDGLDVNGSIVMTDGNVIVNGPIMNDNGALDYLGVCKVTGGLLIAAGSSGMAQAPDASSTQNSVIVNLNSALPGGTLFHIRTEKGKDIVTFAPNKNYQSVVVCSPLLVSGETYTVYTGGSATGTVMDGIYSRGSYSPGSPVSGFTISGSVTMIGSSGMGFPGGGFPGGRPR